MVCVLRVGVAGRFWSTSKSLTIQMRFGVWLTMLTIDLLRTCRFEVSARTPWTTGKENLPSVRSSAKPLFMAYYAQQDKEKGRSCQQELNLAANYNSTGDAQVLMEHTQGN